MQKLSTRQPPLETRVEVLKSIASENGIVLQFDQLPHSNEVYNLNLTFYFAAYSCVFVAESKPEIFNLPKTQFAILFLIIAGKSSEKREAKRGRGAE